MSRTKRLLDEQYELECSDELNSPELLPYKCPKCGNRLRDVTDTSNLSDGQESEYLAGHSRELECPYCDYSGYHNLSEYIQNTDVPEKYQKDIEEYELFPEDFNLNYIPEQFIKYAKRAHNKKCYIESISLIHNLIENFLKNEFKKVFGNFKKARDEFYEKIDQLPTEKFNKIVENKTKLEFKDYFNDLLYLSHWNYIGYIYEMFSFELFNKINKINSKRNKSIHNLLKLKDDSIENKYTDLKYISEEFIELYDLIRQEIRETMFEP